MSIGVVKSVAGKRFRWRERGAVPLLEDVEKAADRMREKDADARAARQELREKIRAAHDEGVPFAVVARAAKLSREWVRRLYAE
jgi:TATA-binding protein-associated factor Taf7